MCHWALQDPVPGVRFFEIISELEQAGRVPAADDLYDWLRASAQTKGLANRIGQVIEQLDHIVSVQKGAGDGDLFYQTLSWYRNQVVTALYRNVDPARRFPLDSYVCGAPPHIDGERFVKALEEEPIPVVQTPSGECFSFGAQSVDSDQVLLVYSMGELIGRLWIQHEAKWPCTLISACNVPYRDAACAVRPFDKGTRRPACPYGAAAAYLGIPQEHALP